jgi:hypothetical protein
MTFSKLLKLIIGEILMILFTRLLINVKYSQS